MDRFEHDVSELDINDPDLVEKWENLMDIYNNQDEDLQIKYIRTALVAIGDL